MAAKLMQSRPDTFGAALDCLGLGRRRQRRKPLSYPASQHSCEEIPLVVVARIDGWLAHASCLRNRINGCAVKAALHEQPRCDIEQPDVARLSLFPGRAATGPPGRPLEGFNSGFGQPKFSLSGR